MGISSTLSSALSGVRLAQAGLDSVAQNIASAGSPGYTKKVLQPTPRIVGGKVIGLTTESVSRVLDTLLQKQVRIENAGSQFADVRSTYASRLDQLYGPPGSTTSLEAVFSNFTNSLQSLATSPESATAQQGAIESAKSLTNRINGISNDIQQLRSEAEKGIADNVNQVNDLLGRLQKVNTQIVGATNGQNEPVYLLDQRDQILDSLSKIIDIKVTTSGDNSVTVNTNSGVLLFDREAAKLSFDGRNALGPNDLYSTDPTKRSTGTITLTTPGGYKSDLIAQKTFQSGQLGAYIALRDDVLVKAQGDLDELASGLSLSLSAQTQTSTATTVAGSDGRQIDLSQLKPGDSVQITLNSGGVPRNVTIVRVDDPAQLPLAAKDAAGTTGEVYGVSFANYATAASSIQTILGAGFAVTSSGTSLTILDDGASNTTDVTDVNARISATTTASGSPALPFFTDPGSANGLYTASVDGGVQKRGYSARLSVNPDLLSDPTRLINITGGSYNAGDPARPQAILERLTTLSTQFAPTGGVATTASSGDVQSFLQRIVNHVGQDAENASQIQQGQEIVVNGLQDRFNESAGVNVDEEIARLIQLQQTYQASARVLTIANQLLQEIFNASK